jgi:preprotein translocase subunit SecG
VFLVIVVLLQHGKGADVGATFGGASNTVFGARGAATVLSKITVGAAFIFMVTSIGLAYLSTSTSSKSLLKETKKVPAATGSPVATGSPAAAVPPASASPSAPAKK